MEQQATGTPHTLYPAEAFTDALEVRSYEAAREGVIRPAVALRYLEALATRASSALGFTPQWYVEHGSAWVVREMSLLLDDLPTISDNLALATWVADFRRVQAIRDYVIAHAGSHQLVARASARWAYLDRASGQLARIHPDLLARMQALGNAMPAQPLQFASAIQALERGEPLNGAQATLVSDFTLVARDYEADVHQHVNNCVYADWLDEGVRLALASDSLGAYGVMDGARTLRPRYLRLEYVRSLRPGEQARIRTYALGRHAESLILWQAITTPVGGNLDGAHSESTALRAYVEYIVSERRRDIATYPHAR